MHSRWRPEAGYAERPCARHFSTAGLAGNRTGHKKMAEQAPGHFSESFKLSAVGNAGPHGIATAHGKTDRTEAKEHHRPSSRFGNRGNIRAQNSGHSCAARRQREQVERKDRKSVV